MTTTTIYTCDRCKQPQKGRHENGGYPPLWIVAITCEPIDHKQQYIIPVQLQTQEWCGDCVDKMGLRRPLLAAPGDPSPPPTLEDLVREIVRKEQQGE